MGANNPKSIASSTSSNSADTKALSTIINYSSLLQVLDNHLSKYKPNKTEKNFRVERLELAKSIFKIGKSPITKTSIDSSSIYGFVDTFFDSNKIKAKTLSFVSLHCTNSLTSGKWFYEVTLFSSGLFQIGFCQQHTPFSDEFCVGDNESSFAFDGFRLFKWHGKSEKYGDYWDYGDVIGVCFDLDERKIEFFLNGKSLGIAFNNIELKGKYYPALSLKKNQKCQLNFGGLPFHYKYEGYEPIDIAECEYTNNLNIIKEILPILYNQVLLVNCVEKIPYDKMDKASRQINQKIYMHLINVAFKDFYLCKEELFKFMSELYKEKKILLKNFINDLKFYVNENNKENMNSFFEQMIDKICNVIEEYSLMGERKLDEYKGIYKVFLCLIEDLVIFDIWINSKNLKNNIECVLNSNSIDIRELDRKIRNKYYDTMDYLESSQLLKKIILTDNVDDYISKHTEKIYLSMQVKFYKTFFSNIEKKLKLNKYIPMIFDLIRENYSMNSLWDVYFLRDENMLNLQGIKNVIYSYLKFFLDKYDIDVSVFPLGSAGYFDYVTLNTFGIRKGFYNEEKIVTTWIDLKNEFFKNSDRNYALYFNLFTRLISPITKLLEFHNEVLNYYKDIHYHYFNVDVFGSAMLGNVYRVYFYSLNKNCLHLLLRTALFIVKWMLYISKNAEVKIFFLPSLFFFFPFELVKNIQCLNEKNIIIKNDSSIKGSKGILYYFNELLMQLTKLTLILFSSEIIRKQSLFLSNLMKAFFYVVKSQKENLNVFNREEFYNNFFIGAKTVVNDGNASFNLLKIISIILIHQNNKEEIYFIKGIKIFTSLVEKEKEKINESLMKELTKFMNKKMNKLVTRLETSKNNLIENNPGANESYNAFARTLISFCYCIRIYEFCLLIFPEFLFKKGTLSLVTFRSFIISLTSRIINEPYLTDIIEIIGHLNDKNNNILSILENSISSFFAIAKKYNKLQLLTDMIITEEEIFDQPFTNLYNTVFNKKDKDKNIDNFEDKDEIYLETLEMIKKKKNENKVEHINSLSIDKANEDKLCILCYDKIANKKILPCKHVACGNCLMLYMIDKKICFICKGYISNVVDVE